MFHLFWYVVNLIKGRFLRIFRVMSLTKTPQSDSDSDCCEYDSTWEDDESKTVRKQKKTSKKWSDRNLYAAKDMQEFRHRCKDIDDADEPDKMSMERNSNRSKDDKKFHNLDFYTGHASSKPDGVYINQFHKEWQGDYERLEDVHSYIQWLFPIQEQGMNWQAHVLTKQEIKLFRENELAKQNLLKSYKLMLDFYGIRLVNKYTGDVERANNWKERFNNLNRYTHNNLRITRILKCLGTLGFEHYQEKLVKFFLHETLVKNMLPNVKRSVLDYFMFTVLDKKQRQDLVKYAFKHFQPQKEFVWGPKKLLSAAVNEHETNETGMAVENESEASGEKTTQEESTGMQEGGMRHGRPTSHNAEDTGRGRIRQKPVCNPNKNVLDPAENESRGSEENPSQEGEESCRMQEEQGGVTPDSHTTENTGRDQIRQELVSDPAEQKSTAYGENTNLAREPIRNQERVEILNSNTTKDERTVINVQKTQGQQNYQDMIYAMEDKNVKQSGVKDQMQGNQIPESNKIGEQTSNESDEISHDRKESSNSAQGEEKNGSVDHKKHLDLML